MSSIVSKEYMGHMIGYKRWNAAKKYLKVVQDIKEDNKTVVWCAIRVTDGFEGGVGLYQGLAPNHFLFAVVMDKLTDKVSRL